MRRDVRRVALALVAGGAMAGAARLLLRPTVQLKVGGLMRPGQEPSIPLGKPPTSPWTWLEIGPDDRVHFYSPKPELGQGAQTGLAQLLAEELQIDLDCLVVHQPDTARGFDPKLLAALGGTSVNSLSRPLREAGARLREALRAEAAARLGCEPGEIVAEHGRCFVRDDPHRSLSYGEIVAGKRGAWTMPVDPPALKEPDRYRLVGHSAPRLDLPDKVTGRAVFGFDVRLPGMIYGAVARPPHEGARLRRVGSVAAAERQPGVVKVVAGRGFAGVVAERRSQAYAALAHLDLEWVGGTTAGQAEIEARVVAPERGGAVVERAGDAAGHLGQGRQLRAGYRSAMFAALPFEPPVAVADVRPDGVTIHVPGQEPAMVRAAVARALGRRKRNVRVIAPYAGGSFGRKHGHLREAAPEAARLSAAVGRPVHVGWSMAEELAHGPVRPPSHHLLFGSLDPTGRARALEHRFASAQNLQAYPPLSLLPKLTGVDAIGLLGAYLTYGAVPHRRTLFRHAPIPVLTSTYRAPGLHPNAFAVESFVDELAHLAGADPLSFRLAHLGSDDVGRRLRLVLEAVSGRAGWWEPAPPGHARGVACCAYGDLVAAEVAEVSVEGGSIRVHRMTCAVDMGFAVNPDAARAQVEGGIAMGLSWALHEEIRIEGGTRSETGLDDYPILTLDEMPMVDTVLLDDGPRLSGPSEVPIGPVAAAVANAVFALTGQRLRKLPLRPPEWAEG